MFHLEHLFFAHDSTLPTTRTTTTKLLLGPLSIARSQKVFIACFGKAPSAVPGILVWSSSHSKMIGNFIELNYVSLICEKVRCFKGKLIYKEKKLTLRMHQITSEQKTFCTMLHTLCYKRKPRATLPIDQKKTEVSAAKNWILSLPLDFIDPYFKIILCS